MISKYFRSGISSFFNFQYLNFIKKKKKSLFSVRGRLGSVWLFIRNIGVLTAFIFGATLEYRLIPCICVFVPITFAIVFFMLPNTPKFYLHKGHTMVNNCDFDELQTH